MSDEEVIEIEGWRVDLNQFYTHAERRQTVVEVDSDSLCVNAEEGSGYMREQITTYVPLPVLFRLLEAAGYSVSRRES